MADNLLMSMTVPERLAILESENKYQNETLAHMNLKINRTLEKLDAQDKVLSQIQNNTAVDKATDNGMKRGIRIALIIAVAAGAFFGGRGLDFILRFIK